VIDGVRREFPPATYDGAAELAPGDTLRTLISVDDLEPPPSPGAHEVAIEMAGFTSPTVEVRLPPR
jgi:hypothetical protein